MHINTTPGRCFAETIAMRLQPEIYFGCAKFLRPSAILFDKEGYGVTRSEKLFGEIFVLTIVSVGLSFAIVGVDKLASDLLWLVFSLIAPGLIVLLGYVETGDSSVASSDRQQGSHHPN